MLKKQKKVTHAHTHKQTPSESVPECGGVDNVQYSELAQAVRGDERWAERNTSVLDHPTTAVVFHWWALTPLSPVALNKL